MRGRDANTHVCIHLCSHMHPRVYATDIAISPSPLARAAAASCASRGRRTLPTRARRSCACAQLWGRRTCFCSAQACGMCCGRRRMLAHHRHTERRWYAHFVRRWCVYTSAERARRARARACASGCCVHSCARLCVRACVRACARVRCCVRALLHACLTVRTSVGYAHDCCARRTLVRSLIHTQSAASPGATVAWLDLPAMVRAKQLTREKRERLTDARVRALNAAAARAVRAEEALRGRVAWLGLHAVSEGTCACALRRARARTRARAHTYACARTRT